MRTVLFVNVVLISLLVSALNVSMADVGEDRQKLERLYQSGQISKEMLQRLLGALQQRTPNGGPVIDVNGTWHLKGYVNYGTGAGSGPLDFYLMMHYASGHFTVLTKDAEPWRIVKREVAPNRITFTVKDGPQTHWNYLLHLDPNQPEIIQGQVELLDTSMNVHLRESCKLISVPCPDNLFASLKGMFELVKCESGMSC